VLAGRVSAAPAATMNLVLTLPSSDVPAGRPTSVASVVRSAAAAVPVPSASTQRLTRPRRYCCTVPLASVMTAAPVVAPSTDTAGSSDASVTRSAAAAVPAPKSLAVADVSVAVDFASVLAPSVATAGSSEARVTPSRAAVLPPIDAGSSAISQPMRCSRPFRRDGRCAPHCRSATGRAVAPDASVAWRKLLPAKSCTFMK
jgi:hypothetical protein